MCEIIPFGDSCFPESLSDILSIKKKYIWALVGCSLEGNLKYLQTKNFKSIYDKSKLVCQAQPSMEFLSEKNKLYDAESVELSIFHEDYGFSFLHFYDIDYFNKCVRNYNYVVKEFNKRIETTLETFKNSNPVIFVHICDSEYIELSVIINLINELESWMKKPFFLFIFIYKKSTSEYISDTSKLPPNVSITELKFLSNYWVLPFNERINLYREFYSRFYETCRLFQLQNYFPLFEDTTYFKACS